jgi:hypothetical protein
MASRYFFSSRESNLILSVLIRVAILLGYKPNRRIFFRKGKWCIIRELRDYILDKIGDADEIREITECFRGVEHDS